MNELIYPDPDAPRLTSVEVTGDYAIRVVFSDGVTFEADIGRWYVHDGKPISGPEDFARVRLDLESDTLLWPNDFFHVHGEQLYDQFATERARS